MTYSCTYCGVRSQDQIFFECPVCGRLSLKEKEGKWFCREHGEVQFEDIVLICKTCGKLDIQAEAPEEAKAEQGVEMPPAA